MKLVVGLGNIGNEYNNTRHNIGFMAIDKIVNNYGLQLDKEIFSGKYTTTIINNEKYIFLKPEKYMNLSGEVIKDFINYFKIDLKDLLVIHDDLDMELGKIRLKQKGSSGGHNGLKNIELYIKTNEYNRIKVGIANNKLIDTKDYVLGKFNKNEQEIINDSLNTILNIFIDYVNCDDYNKLMNRYN